MIRKACVSVYTQSVMYSKTSAPCVLNFMINRYFYVQTTIEDGRLILNIKLCIIYSVLGHFGCENNVMERCKVLYPPIVYASRRPNHYISSENMIWNSIRFANQYIRSHPNGRSLWRNEIIFSIRKIRRKSKNKITPINSAVKY